MAQTVSGAIGSALLWENKWQALFPYFPLVSEEVQKGTGGFGMRQ